MRLSPLRSVCHSLSCMQLEHCVPKHSAIPISDLYTLKYFIEKSRNLFVMTGAGISTESGIKDYRSEAIGLYATTTHRPTTYDQFIRKPEVRQRYWARNATAWPIFSSFKPNLSHKFLASLEHRGKIHWLVTQNVDNLHHKAGSRKLTELHGTVFSVICLDCHSMYPRPEIQEQIQKENPGWAAQPRGFAPDADVFLDESMVKLFKTPKCLNCGEGTLRPDVVFFGDTVPKLRVELINNRLSESDACLVVGSSLQTYSSFRHVKRAKELGMPVLVLNIGPTRADSIADIKLNGRCGEAFEWLQDKL